MTATYKSLDFLGYPKYRVGDDGSVWSLRGGRWKQLKTGNSRYPTLCLCRDGKVKTYHVHRLVLLAFVGPCPEGMLARHFPDPNTQNNKLCNLSWATPKENQNDRVKDGTHVRGESNYKALVTEKDVVKIRELWATGRYKLRELGEMFGMTFSGISQITTRRNWKHVK